MLRHAIVAAEEIPRHVETAQLEVQNLAPGSRAALVLEFRDTSGRLIRYVDAAASPGGSHTVSQTATAPAGTAEVDFVVDVLGGGGCTVRSADVKVWAPRGRSVRSA